MKSNIIRFSAIALLLTTGVATCTQDFNEESALKKTATRSSTEVSADVNFLYAEGGKREYFSIRKDRVLVKAVQEQQAQIETLKAEIATLKNR